MNPPTFKNSILKTKVIFYKVILTILFCGEIDKVIHMCITYKPNFTNNLE